MPGPNDIIPPGFAGLGPSPEVTPEQEAEFLLAMEQQQRHEAWTDELLSSNGGDMVFAPDEGMVIEPDPEMVFAPDEGMVLDQITVPDGAPTIKKQLLQARLRAQQQSLAPEAVSQAQGAEPQVQEALPQPPLPIGGQDPLDPYPGPSELSDPFADEAPLSTADEIARLRAMTPEQRLIDADDKRKSQEALILAQREADIALDKERYIDNQNAAAAVKEEAAVRTAELMRKSEELASIEIDPGRWASNKSVASSIMTVIAAGIAGALNPGGKNSVIDGMSQAIQQDINAQVADLKNRRGELDRETGLVAKFKAQGMSDFEAAEATRVVWRRFAMEELESEAAKYASDGTSASRIMAQVDAMKQQETQAMLAHREKLEKLGLARATANRQDKDTAIRQQRADELNRHNRAGENAQRRAQRAAAEAARAKTAKENRIIPASKISELTNGKYSADMTFSQFKEIMAMEQIKGKDKKLTRDIENQGALAELNRLKGGELEDIASAGPGGVANAIALFDGSPLRNDDKTIFSVSDPAKWNKVSTIMKTAKHARHLADQMKVVRSKIGSMPWAQIKQSKEYQKLTSMDAAVNFNTFVGFGLGAPSAGDQAMAEDAKGGVDSKSWFWSQDAGLDSYADNLESMMMDELRTMGFEGDDIVIPAYDFSKDDNQEKTVSDYFNEGAMAPIEGSATSEQTRRDTLIAGVSLGDGATRDDMLDLQVRIAKSVEDGDRTIGQAKELLSVVSHQWEIEKKVSEINAMPGMPKVKERMIDDLRDRAAAGEVEEILVDGVQLWEEMDRLNFEKTMDEKLSKGSRKAATQAALKERDRKRARDKAKN